MKLAPIALFVYNRPQHVRQTVDALLQNSLAGESDLFIFSDAPKTVTSAQAVHEVREYIKTITGFRTISIVERDKNWGLANSVIDGVTSVSNEFGRIIVLEDDLIVDKVFLSYMNEALERYQSEPKIMQISGYMFPIEVEREEAAFFLPFTTSWGWATWQRAWDSFDPFAEGSHALGTNKVSKNSFDLDGAFPYFKMLLSQLRGEIDSWAILWYLSVFMQKGLVLYPPRSLVKNSGFDGSGTHCGKLGAEQSYSAREAAEAREPKLPKHVAISPLKHEAVIRFMKKSKPKGFVNKLKGMFQ